MVKVLRQFVENLPFHLFQLTFVFFAYLFVMFDIRQ